MEPEPPVEASKSLPKSESKPQTTEPAPTGEERVGPEEVEKPPEERPPEEKPPEEKAPEPPVRPPEEVRKKPKIFELLTQPEGILGIAALLLLVAGSLERQANMIVLALLMGGSAMISLGFVVLPFLKPVLVFPTVSATFGAFLLFRWVDALVVGQAGTPFAWLVFISSLLSLLAAYMVLMRKTAGRM
jgi:hypothetical protein